MDIKIIIIFVLILVSTVLFIRKSEHLTNNILPFDALSNVTPFSSTSSAGIGTLYYIGILLNELSKNPIYYDANAFMLITGPSGSGYSPYSSDAQLEQMFETAYTQGESGLPEKDRVLLRQLAFYSSLSLIPFGDITYTDDGIPTYTSQIINDSGKPVKEFLFNAIIGNSDSINKILPTRFSRYAQDDDLVTNETDPERTRWVKQALSIPHAWIAWLAKNKWNLDMTWKPSYCSAGNPPTPSRIISKPSGTAYGPGTYTIAQLGNPTSIELYAPIRVQTNRSTGGTSNETISTRMGCIYSPDNVNNITSNVTSITVSIPN